MYINSFCSIVPAGIVTVDTPSSTLKMVEGQRGFCIEPDYKDLIPAMQLRRMSKPVRTGVAAAKLCLRMGATNTVVPDAIHVGTAYGMLQDSEVFLQKIIEQEEQMLSPTAFIQSTHNTVGGQIALALSCNAHNMTFVHKSHSFENALLDASLLLQENPTYQVLVGGVDECTDSSFDIINRFASEPLAIQGEGATFFSISALQVEQTLARIVGFTMFYASNNNEPGLQLGLFLAHNLLEILPSDLVVHGDIHLDRLTLFVENEKINFKSYCGSYPTAAAFALALATIKVKEQPERRCWIINQAGPQWSIWLIAAAK